MANNSVLSDFKIVNDLSAKRVHVDCFFGKRNPSIYSTDSRQYTSEEDREKIVKELYRLWSARLNRTKAFLEKYLD
jgi:hypothetical protein